ncbi:MAG: magnesium transporter CorA family protein [Gammaproteobacteria bacterium]|nr:magnesium transporter CorA family protein [Gammaproteobacteria bacterium]
MMQFMLCHNNTSQVGGKELLQQWQAQPNSWIWVDLYEESVTEEQLFLSEQFALDHNVISEAQRSRHPPSFEVFENYIYLLLKPLDAESDSLDFNTFQLAFFASDRFLITRRTKESPYLARLWQRLEQNGSTDESPMTLVAAMSHRVAQRYGGVLLDLEQRLDIIEDELFDSPTDTLMKELVGYNTGLRKMHRILAYYVEVFGTLRNELQNNGDHQHAAFNDIYALIERFNSLSTLYQNVITDLIEAYISLNGHRLNQIMKVLTIVTVVFVPLTLLVGIYGMNFENMPELKSKHGYYILLSAMSGIAVVMLYLFRRVRWL